jgi:hypothetical protein
MSAKWSRRRLLAGTAAGAALLPFVPRLEAEAGGAEVPKRFIVYFTPDGTIPSAFFPAQIGTDFELPAILQPLAAHQSDLVVIKGLDNRAAEDGPGGGGHIGGMGAMLTGRPILPDGFVESGDNYSYEYGFAAGPSIDQVIAQEIGEDTAFRSIEAGLMVDHVGSNAGRTQYRMTYAAANQPIAPENDPAALFDRMFADLVLDDPAALARLRARRQSVIDVVRGDLNAVKQRVGAFDRARIDGHLDAVRELEARLNAPVTPCTPPDATYDWNPLGYGDPQVQTWQAHIDLVVRAMVCDLTRVASLQWMGEGRGASMSFLGFSDGEHNLSHSDDDDAVGVGKLLEIKVWWASQLALLVDALKAQAVGDGSTLFDHTVVLWCSGIGKGNSHANTDLPFALLGSAGGAFATGRSLDAGGIPHNALLVSIAQAMGLDVDQFGDPVYGSGPVPGLA